MIVIVAAAGQEENDLARGPSFQNSPISTRAPIGESTIYKPTAPARENRAVFSKPPAARPELDHQEIVSASKSKCILALLGGLGLATIVRPAAAAAVDLKALVSPVLLRGDATHAYRDPAVCYHDGEFHLFFTYNPPPDADGRVYWYTAVSRSRDLARWTEPRLLTPKDQTRNYSSPGNVIRFGDEWVLCLQTYPIPGVRQSDPVRFGDATARLFIMRSRNLETWSAPELLQVKGPNVPVEAMGRMIDPYLIEDASEPGKWWCFFKQNGASRSWSRDLKTWQYEGRFPAGENACVVRDGDDYVLFHSPSNGVGIKRSKDLSDWRDEGLLTLGQSDWAWAQNGRLTAGFVLDLRRDPAVGKALMFFHASAYPEKSGGFWAHCSIGLAWSDDLKTWTWPGPGRATARPRLP